MKYRTWVAGIGWRYKLIKDREFDPRRDFRKPFGRKFFPHVRRASKQFWISGEAT